MDERHRQQSTTVSAKTVDDAIAEAERELGVSREHLDITVITEGSRGFLGVGSENARILAIAVDASASLEASVSAAEQTGGVDSSISRVAHAPEQGIEPVVHDEESQRATADAALEILQTLLGHMEIEAHTSIRKATDPIVLDIQSESSGLLIGRRGETLSALQYLVNVLIGKRTSGWTKVVLDVEHWRDRREEALRHLALRQADQVREQRRPISLDPMPANERRIVHMTLQGEPDIETFSEGDEPNRYLVIALKPL